MKRYKLVTQDYKTRAGYSNETTWSIGVRVAAVGSNDALCSNGVIHSYASPELAAFLNPIHADIVDPRCLELDAGPLVADDGLKGGHKYVTPTAEIKLPRPTLRQRVIFAILCTRAIPGRAPIPEWDAWASTYLRGAADTAYAAADAAADTAYAAADAAADAAARAAYAAARAAYAAARAAYTADAAAYAARAADAAIDFVAIAKKAMLTEESA